MLNICATDNIDSDVDVNGDMPTSCTSEFIIAVTNTNINNDKVPAAAFGSRSIDIGAPGTDNFTTSPNNNYNFVTGTSVAAPLVGGTVALLYSAPCQSIADEALINPGDVALTMKNIIYSGATESPSLRSILSQGSVLNVLGSMEALDRNCIGGESTENRMSILQNPIKQYTDDIVVDYIALEDGEEIFISVFDSKGALIRERSVNRTFFGENRISISTQSGFNVGVYFVSLMLPNNESITQKVIIY